MHKLLVALVCAAACAASVPAQSQQAPTLRIVSEDGNRLPSELFYGNTKVKPLRLRPGTNTPITIDDSDFFVQQQYVDFLSRFPDQGGFSFWQNQITGCGADAQCVQVRRINVSAAFFLSIEFQETGYLVYRMYKAAYGDINPPSVPVPVRREEFMPDSRRLAQGVVVGVGDWQAQLEANKNAYAQEFVSTSRFTAAYPASMTPEQFVDALNQRAGGALSQAERDSLVSQLRAGQKTRGGVVRAVAEDADLARAEFNRAFVLMQYFGYLKRNPSDAPDSNYDGWQFWLNQLNRFGGNFQQAEMVRAFIESIEYRARF